MRKLVLLVGPTCSGKSTLEQELNRRGIPSVISYTTRAPRVGEINGVHYQFLTKDQVLLMEAHGDVCQRVEFGNNYYGSTLAAMNQAFASSDTAVIVVEPTGVTQFQAYAAATGLFTVVPVYIDGPYARLVTRLIDRYAADTNADAGYYWTRLVQQRVAHHEWPRYIDNWSIYIDEIDEGVPNKTVANAAGLVLETISR